MSQGPNTRFFLAMGLLLTAIVVAGFTPTTLQRAASSMGLSMAVVGHGVLFLGWYVLFDCQAWLIGRGSRTLHRTLGYASLALVASMLLVGHRVASDAFVAGHLNIAGMNNTSSFLVPLTDLVMLSIAYLIGVVYRKSMATHQRAMLLVGILMIDPAAARLVTVVGGPPPFIVLMEFALVLALVVYDVRSRGRIHPMSLVGLALLISSLVSKFWLSQQSLWLDNAAHFAL